MHVGRQQRVGLSVWQDEVTHVYEIGLTGTYTPCKADGIIDRLMCGMEPVVEGIDDEYIHVVEVWPLGVGHRLHVGDVGQCAEFSVVGSIAVRSCLDAKAHDRQAAVHYTDGCDRERTNDDGFVWHDVAQRYGRHSWIAALGRCEAVWDALHEMAGHKLLGIDGDVAEEYPGAYVVNSSNVVEMFVGDEDSIDVWEMWQGEHLLTEVGTAVEQYGCTRMFDKRRGAEPMVARVAAHTSCTSTCYLRHSAAGSTAKYRQFHFFEFLSF